MKFEFERRNGRLTRVVEFAGEIHRSTLKDRSEDGLTVRQAWDQSILRGERPASLAPSKEIVVVDAFCGSGGLALGIQNAIEAIGKKARFLAAIDLDADAVKIHQRNFGVALPLPGDAASLLTYSIVDKGERAVFTQAPKIVHTELAKHIGAVDVFVAGPPCQGHSNLNNYTRRQDPRNKLYLTAVAIAMALEARAIVIENVPTVLNSHSDEVNTAIALLEAGGYGVSTGFLRADLLGAAQRRMRHFLVAVKGRDIPEDAVDRQARRLAADASPLSWAIGDLRGKSGATLFDAAPKILPVNAARIDYLFDHGLFNLPDAQRPACHQNGTSYTSVYGRMHWDRPAQTITTGFGTAGQGRYIHPLERRLITPHEAARIQGFPDWFDFTIPGMILRRKHLAKWIGDAVHPVLGFAAGTAALSALEELVTADVEDAA